MILFIMDRLLNLRLVQDECWLKRVQWSVKELEDSMGLGVSMKESLIRARFLDMAE